MKKIVEIAASIGTEAASIGTEAASIGTEAASIGTEGRLHWYGGVTVLQPGQVIWK